VGVRDDEANAREAALDQCAEEPGPEDVVLGRARSRRRGVAVV
jgi:hypothetical protein